MESSSLVVLVTILKFRNGLKKRQHKNIVKTRRLFLSGHKRVSSRPPNVDVRYKLYVSRYILMRECLGLEQAEKKPSLKAGGQAS